MVKILKLTEEKFARAWLNPLNDSSAGCIKSDGGKSKTRVKLQSYYFVGTLNIVLSYKKMFSMTKIARFLLGFSVLDFQK